MDMTTMEEQPMAQPPPPEGLDDGMMFWARMASECLDDGGGDDANVTVNDNVGPVLGYTNKPARKDAPHELGPSAVGIDNSEGSTTDSSHADVGPLTQPISNGM